MTLADAIANWIRDHVDRAGAQGVTLGLSGGIDSAVVAALATRGLGPERVYGVIMPAESATRDRYDAEDDAVLPGQRAVAPGRGDGK